MRILDHLFLGSNFLVTTYFSGSQKNHKDKVLDGNNLWGIRDVPTCTQIGMCVQLDAAISTGF